MRRAHASGETCGVVVAESAKVLVSDAVAELTQGLQGGAWQHVLVFYGPEYEPRALTHALTLALPCVPISGCSTAGGIGPLGMQDGGIILVAFPREGFRIHTGIIEDVAKFGVERASDVVRQLKYQISPQSRINLRERVFGLFLVDGLSNAEEPLVAAVHWAFDDMQLVGGSSGDGLAFRRTSLLHGGRVLTGAAILIVIESEFPFRIFKTENFDPTPIKLVVTAADAERRIVYELNAEPAAREYAAAIGLMQDDLGPFSFASYPLVVKVGGDYYCRSIRNMNPDGSLSFFCAIDEGLVFTVARPTDMVQSTERVLKDVERSLDGIDVALGFDCILRRLDAEARQIKRPLEELYRNFGVVGFNTYGEQLNAMHLNQTLTGIAFGARRGAR